MTVRRFLLAAIAFGIGCASVPPHYAVAPASDQPYPSGDAAAVYRAVLDKLYLSSSESPPFVVLWDSARYITIDCPKWPCPILPPHKSVISRELVRAFEEATRLTTPLNSSFGFSLPVMLLSDSDRHGLEAKGAPLSDSLRRVNNYSEQSPYWLGFRKRYPGAWGYTVLTRVGFDRKREHALVQLMHRCSSSCEHMEDMLLAKIDGRWQVIERILVGPRGSDWVDVVQRFYSPIGDGKDSMAFGPLRYLGPDAHYLVNALRWNDSVKTMIRDSIARDQLPRRISGTIRSRLTRLRLPFAEIIAHVQPNDTKVRIVSDSAGRYAFNNLPIGGTMLEVQCPESQGADGRTLDAPGLYAHAAIDTIVDFAVPDIAPCWHVRTIHQLQPGWFESKEATLASNPDSEERGVYASVIASLHASNRHTRIAAIFSHTIPRCTYQERCGTVQLARLARAGLVDSSLIKSFYASTSRSVALSPAFALSLGLHVVTPQEIAYFAEDPVQFGYRHVDFSIDSALFWAAFRKLNGSEKGIVSLSGVGFDEGRSRALVEARLDTAQSRSPSTMLLLRKEHGHWRVVLRDVGKRATSGEWSGDRCMPGVAPPLPTKRAIAGLRGDFTLTMAPTAGHSGTGSDWLRLSATSPGSKGPPVFEIIDSKTDRPDRNRSEVLWIHGAVLDIQRASGRTSGSEYAESLRILRVTPSGFFGSWGAGVYGPGEFGYFCAIRR